MSKITVIEGNSNDKNNVRNFMVKGEKGEDGVSPTVETSKTGSTATITITDAEGDHSFDLTDGVSPTITSEKTGKVTTLTITDVNETRTVTINDGADGATANIIDDEALSDYSTQTYSGRIIETKFSSAATELVNYAFNKSKFAVIQTSHTFPTGTVEDTFSIEFPNSFTKYNSVVLSAMFSNTNNPSYQYETWTPFENNNYIAGNIVVPTFSLELGDTFNTNPSKINVTYSRPSASTEEVTFYFKIVLMRID